MRQNDILKQHINLMLVYMFVSELYQNLTK